MQIGQAERLQGRSGVEEDRGRIAVDRSVGAVRRRQTDADPVRADGGDHGGRDLQHEAGAVLDRTAITVVALVGTILEELVDQIAVGGMDLDTVEAGLPRLFGGVDIVSDDALDFVDCQRTRRLKWRHREVALHRIADCGDG